MTLYKNKYRIESARLPGRDYSLLGYYFITTNVRDRLELLGVIKNGKMLKNEYGDIVQHCWDDLPNHYPNMKCDSFVVMPNHIHCIIRLIYQGEKSDGVENGQVETGLRPVSTDTSHITKPASISEIMRALKSFSARQINTLQDSPGIPIWQPRFFDRILYGKRELLATRKYIEDNPLNWEIKNDQL